MGEYARPREVFEPLINGVSEKRWAEVLDLYADDAVVEHPFAPSAQLARLEGRDQLREHFDAASGGPEFDFHPENVVVHHTADPEVVIGEFEYRGRVVDTGRPCRFPCVFVLRVRDGRIVESRDYTDVVRFAEATGRLSELAPMAGGE